MHLDELQKRLLAAGRAQPPVDTVPYAFEKRIMARLRQRSAWADPLTLWNRVLWRAAAPCVAIMLLSGALAWWDRAASTSPDTLATDLEDTVYAAMDVSEEIW